MEQREVLKGLKNWFYGLDKVESDDEEDPTDMESYITSLADVLHDTRAAARKLDDNTVKSTDKLGDVMRSLRRIYNDALRPKSKGGKKTGGEGEEEEEEEEEEEDPSLKIIALEKDLRDANFQLSNNREAFERESRELNRRLEKADVEINSFLEQNNFASFSHREQIQALKKKCLVLEEEKAALDVKCRRIETISRDPMIGALFKGGESSGGGMAAEKAELEALLEQKEEEIKILKQNISELETKMSFFKDQMADSDFGLDDRIRQAENRAKKETANAFQDVSDMNAVLKEDVISLKDQMKSLNDEKKAGLEFLKANYDAELAKLKEELKSQSEYFKNEINARNKTIFELEETVEKGGSNNKNGAAKNDAANKEAIEKELAELKKELEVERGERRASMRQLSESKRELEEQRVLNERVLREVKEKEEVFEKEKQRAGSRMNGELGDAGKARQKEKDEKKKKKRKKNGKLSSEDDITEGEGAKDEEIKRLQAELAKATSSLNEANESIRENGEKFQGLEGSPEINELSEQLAEAQMFRRQSEAIIFQHQQSSDRYKDKLEHLANLCAPPELMEEDAENHQRRETLMSVIFESTDEDNWKDSEAQLFKIGAVAHANGGALRELLASIGVEGIAGVLGDVGASVAGGDDKNLKKALAAAQNELKDSEEARQELTVKNAGHKRRIAELENLLKKTKDLLAENVEKLGSKMSKDMVDAAKKLNENMKSQMAASRAADDQEKSSKRKISFANVKNIANSVAAFKSKKGGKSARLERLKKLSSNVSSGSGTIEEETSKETAGLGQKSSEEEVQAEAVELKEPEKEVKNNDVNEVGKVTVEVEDTKAETKDEEKKEDNPPPVDPSFPEEEVEVVSECAPEPEPEPAPAPAPAPEAEREPEQKSTTVDVAKEEMVKGVKEVEEEKNEKQKVSPPETSPLPSEEIPPKPKRGVGISIAMKMNMRRRGLSVDSEGSEKKEEEKKDTEEKKPPLEKKLTHTFEDRLLYFGVKKQKVALSSAVSANIKANSIASKLFKKAKKTSQEKADKLAEEAKLKEEALEEQKKDAERIEIELKVKQRMEEELTAKINKAAAKEKKMLEEEREALRLEHEAMVKKMKEDEEERKRLEEMLQIEKEEIAQLEEMVEMEDKKIEELDQRSTSIKDELDNTTKELEVAEQEVEKHLLVEEELKRQLFTAVAPDVVAELEEKLRIQKIEQEEAEEKQRMLKIEIEEQALAAAQQEEIMLLRVAELEEKLANEKKKSDEISEAHRQNILQQAENIEMLQAQLKNIKIEAVNVNDVAEREENMEGVDGHNEMMKKLTEEHERTLQEMARTMAEKSQLLELKESDLSEAQDMIHNLRVKVIEGEGEIMNVRKQISRHTVIIEQEKKKAAALMKEREVEKEELRLKVERKQAELQEGDEEGKKMLADNQEGYQKVLELMKDSETLLLDKEEELKVSKKSVEEVRRSESSELPNSVLYDERNPLLVDSLLA